MSGAEPDALAVYAATTAQVLWDMGTLGVDGADDRADDPREPGRHRVPRPLGVADSSRSVASRRHASILRHEVETDFGEHPLNPLWLISDLGLRVLCIELEDRRRGTDAVRILEPWRGRANSSVVSINGLVTESLAGWPSSPETWLRRSETSRRRSSRRAASAPVCRRHALD